MGLPSGGGGGWATHGRNSSRLPPPLSPGEEASRKAALESATGQYLLYLKDTLQDMEKNLAQVRLVVQKGVGSVQRAQSAYRSPRAPQNTSTQFLNEADLLSGLESLKRAHNEVLAVVASSAPSLG